MGIRGYTSQERESPVDNSVEDRLAGVGRADMLVKALVRNCCTDSKNTDESWKWFSWRSYVEAT